MFPRQRPFPITGAPLVATNMHTSKVPKLDVEELQLLPDTHQDSMDARPCQFVDLDAYHNDDLLPDTQNSYPSPPLSLDLETSPTVAFDSSLSMKTLIQTAQKLSCRERKRLVVPMNRPANVTKAMKAWIAKTHYLLDPFREDDECWFHQSPPRGRVTENGTLHPYGTIQKAFAWQDHKGKHIIVLNFGIVSKLLFNKMTNQQIDGFISKQWHLSHLCGNWTCLNPDHTTVEPGPVNISRNSCFSHRSGCGHNPQCMKDKKVFLDADGKQVDPCFPAPKVGGDASQASEGYFDWDDWRHDSDDGVSAIDDVEESECMVASIAGKDGTPHG